MFEKNSFFSFLFEITKKKIISKKIAISGNKGPVINKIGRIEINKPLKFINLFFIKFILILEVQSSYQKYILIMEI